MEDRDLVELFWRRSPQALELTQQAYGPYCRRIALNFLDSPEDAEECLNDTWLRAWNAIPPQRPARLALFLGKITRNLALNRLEAGRAQKRGGGLTVALEELEQCLPAPRRTEEAADAAELARLISRFLRAQPLPARTAFLRRYWYGDGIGEIAAHCGMTAGAVKVSLLRTRRKLKVFLEQEGVSV